MWKLVKLERLSCTPPVASVCRAKARVAEVSERAMATRESSDEDVRAVVQEVQAVHVCAARAQQSVE